MPNQAAEENTLILCEGKEDEAFLRWLADFGGIGGLIIRGVGGKDVSVATIRAFIQDPAFGDGPAVVAAIFDADSRPGSRRTSILRRLERAAPELEHRVYLLPDDESIGELEDLCLMACRDTVRLACADGLVKCLETNGYSEFSKSKLKLLAYVSASKGERRSIEFAAKGGQFDASHPIVQKLLAFLKGCSSP